MMTTSQPQSHRVNGRLIFAEKTFVKQSMMLEWEKCAKKLRFEAGGKLDSAI